MFVCCLIVAGLDGAMDEVDEIDLILVSSPVLNRGLVFILTLKVYGADERKARSSDYITQSYRIKTLNLAVVPLNGGRCCNKAIVRLGCSLQWSMALFFTCGSCLVSVL